jgi:fructan beta-fructosidase
MRSDILVVWLIFTLMACNPSQDSHQSTEVTKADSSQSGKVNNQFSELYRPQFHFSPPSGWMNDPNGMVYHMGEYHLFYQHNPDSTVWGPMHWGHAVSKDMIHWEHLPIALYPDSLGTIFSGSAVVDVDNTSGLGNKDNPAMVAVFTYHQTEGEKAGRKDYQTQGMAYSVDKGRTWKKYKQNPVLKNPGIKDFRDPKVVWHQDSKKWVMILAVTDHVELYGSKDLKSWSKLSEFGKTYGAHGSVWECPDLFPLQVNGQQKWVMLVSLSGGPNGGSATQYFVGNFDGNTFKSDNPAKTTLWMDYGKDNYAGVTWANVPKSDGRRLFMGWMSNWQYANQVPTSSWRSAMTIARELSLKPTPQGIRLVSQPVKELASIRGESAEIQSQSISGEVDITKSISFPLSTTELLFNFDSINESKDVGIELSNAQGQKLLIGYEPANKQFYIDRRQAGKKDFSKEFAGKHTAPGESKAQSIKLYVLLDVASVELFADDGEMVMTEIVFPDEVYNQLKIYAKGGSVQLAGGKITKIESIWKSRLAMQSK